MFNAVLNGQASLYPRVQYHSERRVVRQQQEWTPAMDAVNLTF